MRDSVESALSSAAPAYMIRSLDHLLLRKPLQPTRARENKSPHAAALSLRGPSPAAHRPPDTSPTVVGTRSRSMRRRRPLRERGLQYNDYRRNLVRMQQFFFTRSIAEVSRPDSRHPAQPEVSLTRILQGLFSRYCTTIKYVTRRAIFPPRMKNTSQNTARNGSPPFFRL